MAASQVYQVPGGEVRVFAPDPSADDLGPMYVLDVLGCTLLIRERKDGTYIHVDAEGSDPVDAWPLIVEVNNGGENFYGEERESCGECGAVIPRSEPDMVSTHHGESCSLHPSNTV